MLQLGLLQAPGLSRGPPLGAVSVDPQLRQATGYAEPGVFAAGSAFAACLWEEARKPVLDVWL